MNHPAPSPSIFHLNAIEDAIEDIRAGRVVIVVDDEHRENEGDFVGAAEKVTPEMINFMATHGRGLICVPLTEKRCKDLRLGMMVGENSDNMDTAFTVSVDLKGKGVTTGISASDRSKTIKALLQPETKSDDLARPGHVFPLIAKEGGVLRRTGHTEAAIDLARLAGLSPAGVIVEIMNEDGTMARLPQLIKVAEKFDLKIISIEDLIAYRMRHDSLIQKKAEFDMTTRFGTFRLHAYQQTTNMKVHIALTLGKWQPEEPVLTRVSTSVSDNDLLTALTEHSEEKLNAIFARILKEEKGLVLFIHQNISPEMQLNRLEDLKKLQINGTPVAPKISMDSKDYGIGAQILHDLNVRKIKLMTNSKQTKRVGMVGYGLEIVDYVNY